MKGFISSFSLHFIVLSLFCYSTSFATAAVDFSATGNAIEVGLLNLSMHNERKSGASQNTPVKRTHTEVEKTKSEDKKNPVIKPFTNEKSITLKSDKKEEIVKKEEAQEITLVENEHIGSDGLGVQDVNNAGQTDGNNTFINSGKLGSNAKVLNFTPPVYPESARRAEEEGKVEVEVYTDNKGKIAQLQILKSSGFERLDKATLRAVQRARFAQTEGRVVISVVFRLDD